jgi:hypothetical protein
VVFFLHQPGRAAPRTLRPGNDLRGAARAFSARKPEYGVLDWAHWVAPTSVRPLFRVRVELDEFPLADAVVSANTSITGELHTRLMRLAGLSLLVAAALLAAGCGYGDDDDDDQSAAPPTQATPRVPEPRGGSGSLPVDEFNSFVEQSRPAFATSALRTAIEFANAGDGTAATTSVVALQGPEGNADEASVTVTRDGLADDSVRALRYRIVLERADDRSWRLQSAQRTQRCHEGRGSQEFSTKLCR